MEVTNMPTAMRGFTPSRDPAVGTVRNYPAAASSNQSIAKGDAVALLNGTIVPCTAGQDPTLRGIGVVLAVYTTANRPLTNQTTKIIASAGVGRVDVCIDPWQTYYVQCETSVGLSNIGKNVVLAVSAANATTGLSGEFLQIPASASQNDLFKIVNYGPFDELSGKESGGAVNNGVEVIWNYHAFKATTPGQ
jgi:hypothetical protein